MYSITLLILLLFIPQVRAGLTIGSVSTTSTCYSALHSSSGDDNLIDKSEYVTFINIFSFNAFTYPQYNSTTESWGNYPVSEYNQLPLELQMNFNKLACGGGFIACSEAYIVTNGTAPNEEPTDLEVIYLYEVCSSTEEAIDAAKGDETAGGTTGETDGPTETVTGPTVSPGDEPSVSPIDDSSESPSIPSSGAPSTIGGGTESPISIDLSRAISYNATFQYQILVSEETTPEMIMNSTNQMNIDLVTGMNVWSRDTCWEWNDVNERRLRGARRGLVVVTTDSSVVTGVTAVDCNLSTNGSTTNLFQNITDNSSTPYISLTHNSSDNSTTFNSTDEIYISFDSASNSSNNTNSRRIQWMAQEKNHCLLINQNQTYHLVNENYPYKVSEFIALTFDADVQNGTYLNTIPEPSRSEIKRIYLPPKENAEESQSSAPQSIIPAPVPVVGGGGDDAQQEGKSNTAAIAAGTTIALLVVIVSLFVARRRLMYKEKKEDELHEINGDEEITSNSRKVMDDFSSSDDSSSGSSSDEESVSARSASSQSTSGSEDSYYSNSGSTSNESTAETGGQNGPPSVSASDTDSYASHPKQQRAVAVQRDILNTNPVHDSMDSGSSVDEASLVEEAALDEIDSDSSHDSHDSHFEIDSNVDLTNVDGLEIPHVAGRGSKESSYADDSSAGSSGWNSSMGDSSSTNTESVESFDANMVDVGSSTISKNTSEEDGDEYALDRELLPGAGVNPAVNPVIQPGVSMVPVDDMEDDESDFFSDNSETSATLTKRNDAAPMGYEIRSAIEQGDWSAVGATAAILAPPSHQDDTASQRSEMEALVDSGNWSGIVAVAAKYADDASIQSGMPSSDHGSIRRTNSISSASVESADEDTSAYTQSQSSAYTQSQSSAYTQSQASAGTRSYVSNATESRSTSSGSYTESYSSYTGTGTGTHSYSGTESFVTGTSANTSKYTTSLSGEQTTSDDRISSLTSNKQSTLTSLSSSTDNPEEKQRFNAYRAEVEALVRRVVPDEIDNVDAIMIQFSGREEELIATLRGMQEKTIAQRAKAAVQRSAKKEAKTGGRIADDHTASSEDQSSVNNSSYNTGSRASAMASTVDGCSITEEFAEDSSHSGSEGSESSYYSTDGANETEDGTDYSHSSYSRSDFSHSTTSEYTGRSESHSSGRTESQSSGYSESDGYSSSLKDPPNDLNNLMETGDWHGIIDRASNMRDQAREQDLD